MTDIERENLILKLQQKVMLLQRNEVRKVFSETMEKYQECLSTHSKDKNVEKYSLKQFLKVDQDSGSLILQNAIKFYETHDGCPLHEAACDKKEELKCGSVWIKMGSPCWYLVKTVQRYLEIMKYTP